MDKEQKFNKFKLKAVKTHKGYYIYDKVDYVDSRTKVCIICPIHGEFWQTPSAHVRGECCPKCANKRRGNTFRLTTEEFVKRAKEIHGDKWGYDEVNYINSNTPVRIICPIHGVFEQLPIGHLSGQGCPKCVGRYQTNDEVVLRMKESHPNDDYDYSKVEFSKMHNKVCIICHKKDKYGNEHGEFWQTPAKHVFGRGCPKCANERRNDNRKITLEKFKERANELFNSFYNYDNVFFSDLHDKVKIICPIHGEFTQIVADHLNGHGCTQCAIDALKSNTYEFIIKARQIHGNKYDYSKVNYVHSRIPVDIICLEHGEFQQTPDSHLKGCGCPKCGKIISKNEEELYQFVYNLVGSENVVRNDRSILDGKEIDIYIPTLKVGIEYNGVVWHSEKFGKDKDYHLSKLNIASSKGVKLIQVFEDEYIDHKNIVFGKIRHILGYDNFQQKIYARKSGGKLPHIVQVKEINKDTAKDFLETNHIQGYGKSTLFLGAFHDNLLVAVMGFLKEKEGHWNLTRFATDITKICCGFGGKLFKFFIKNYNPEYIKSFADKRWTLNEDDNLYTKLGFELDKVLLPDYRYIESGSYKRVHKFNFRKQLLHKRYNLPLTMTENEMCSKIGAYKIWDCGLLKYVWKKETV